MSQPLAPINIQNFAKCILQKTEFGIDEVYLLEILLPKSRARSLYVRPLAPFLLLMAANRLCISVATNCSNFSAHRILRL